MGKISFTMCVAVVALLLGCAGNTTIPTDTPADRAALCAQAVTTSRKAATALLRAGKISLEKDREIQDNLNTAIAGCREMALQ